MMNDSLASEVLRSGPRYIANLRACIKGLKSRFNVTLIGDHCSIWILGDSKKVGGNQPDAVTPLEAVLLNVVTAVQKHVSLNE